MVHSRRRAPAILIFMLAALTMPVRAQTPVLLPAGDNPIVRVMVRSGTVIVRTWSRGDVQVVSSQSVIARSFRPEAVAQALSAGSIPIFATTISAPDGPLTLPPEELTLGALPGGPHEGVLVQAQGGDLTLTIPSGTALLLANVGRGRIDLQDYRGGIFALLVHNGGLRLRNVAGTGFVQSARGVIMVGNSSFDHLRARTAIGNIFFENCVARQIDVSSVTGTIIYDNGSFEPGLARFETERGNVALGLGRGNAQINAHSSTGQIFAALDRATVRPGQTDAQFGGYGAAVTASSVHGAIFVYRGPLRSLGARRLGSEWMSVTRFVQRRLPRKPSGRIH